MPASIGVNLRVTGHCRQGGRKYMEDFFSVAYQQTQDEKDLEYAFFGIFDGHGGMEAATFAKEHLMESIVRQKNFWSDRDDDVLKAIKDGYINTHYAMWREQEKWPKTASGLPSTAGTTASVAFIRRGKIYIGHVGDSGIILGYQEPGNAIWQARPLTEDHKPENQSEMSRIEQSGGKVVTKSGVPRVVWNRPRIGHKGPVRRSTPIDEIPFLAVARSLGDLWSYNSALDEFVVSPDPDTICIPINAETFRCLIFGTDGLWNMISPASAVSIVQVAEKHNERTVLAAADSQDAGGARANKVWINPSKCLVERALERWSNTRMRADNTSVITLMLDPPGPPRAEVIKNQRLLENRRQLQQTQPQQQPEEPEVAANTPEEIPEYPKNGLEILTMYEDPPLVYPAEPFPEEAASTAAATTPQNEFTETNAENVEPTHKNVPNPEQENKPERRLTEENLNKIHRQILNDINNAQNQNQNQFDENYPETSTEGRSVVCETTSSLVDQPAPLAQSVCESRLKSQTNVYACAQHQQDVCKVSAKPEPELRPDVKSNETIQINEVSSSSPDKPLNPDDAAAAAADGDDDDDEPCSRCTRSQDLQKTRKSLRTASSTSSHKQKIVNPSPSRRKTRSTLIKTVPLLRKTFAGGGPSKREHSDHPAVVVEPPPKLRRSQSLGPRDFTLRSQKTERSLRERTGSSLTSLTSRNGAIQGRSSLVTLSAGSANSYRKFASNGKHFTPVKQAIQTRNRVKRLNK